MHSLTYPHYENSSGWNLMLDKLPYVNPLDKIDKYYDFIIIGAGFTGFACANRLAELEPNKSILIIEATEVGEGSSGRNTGFLLPLHRTANNSYENKIKQLEIYSNGISWLKEKINQLKIDCDWSECPKIDAAATDLGVENLKRQEEEYKKLGIKYNKLSREDINNKTGTSYYKEGLEVFSNVFIQPAKLIRGYANNLPDNVTLIQSTPVICIEKGMVNKVITRNHEFLTEKIILANNGFAKKLGFLKSRVVTIYTYAGITPVLDEDELSLHGNDQKWGIIPAHRLGTTLRKYNNERMMVRSYYSYEKPKSQYEADTILTDCYKRRYPNLKKHLFEFVWGGVTALTFNNQSFFGKYKDSEIYISTGCNGVGGVKGTTHGKYLAELAVGKKSAELDWLLAQKRPSYLPPEPFRKIGAMVSIQYNKYKAGLEK